MKNSMKKILLVSALVIAIAASSVLGASAFSWNDLGNQYEDNAEEYADQIEQLVEEVGQGFEDNAEQYPSNPDPEAYMDTVNELSNKFLSGIKSLTEGYLKTFRF